MTLEENADDILILLFNEGKEIQAEIMQLA